MNLDHSSNAQNFQIDNQDKELLKKVALRVSDLANCKIKEGNPCTDGKTIYLPLNQSKLSFFDLEGLAAHEGGHIRFKSILDPDLPFQICPKAPLLGQIVLNICEDARIETILKSTFSGFWDELDQLNLRFMNEKLPNISKNPHSAQDQPEFIDFLLFLISINGISHPE
ncbi:MAG: hypothetical protein ACTSUI_05315, partial [Promethearchaeota archaeon]